MTPEEWQEVKGLFAHARERPVSERAAFLEHACSEQPEQRRQVESLLACSEESWSLLDGPPAAMLGSGPAPDAADTRVGQHIGPYEIVSEIGHGGMGTVYLARRADGQFDQTVALKLVRRGMDTDAVLARFRNEREILARLHHPHIAQLYDGGATQDGLPFFAMEHVDGEPLLDDCTRRQLSTAERLKLFREVCSAVHYAHQNLVVHRDIKPSNILMTPGGAPKLLDFGIAKVLDSSSGDAADRTATALRAMTPDYASPEQVRGEPVTTATDVYSLGVVLYELLSGRRPYRVKTGEPEELARLVCQEEPERPSAVVSELRGDLDNIVLMAMRKEPQRRYASVEQLAEDIRRHLDGRPVLARRDTVGYRLGKFVRRNRVSVAAAVVVFFALLGGIGFSLREAATARAERAKAQRRFNDVRRLAGSFLFEFHDAVENLPGSTPVRALVVQRALEYLDGLAREGGGDPALRAELAAAYQKVGDVQGGLHASLGDTKGAIESYRKSVALREPLAAADPKNLDRQLELASSYRALAQAQEAAGDAKASESMERAIRIYEDLAASPATDPRVQSNLGVAYWERAQPFIARGDYRGALELHRRAAAVAEELLKKEPRNTRYQYNLALYQKNLGALLEKVGKPSEGLELYRKAAALDEARVAAEPNDASARLDLSFSYGGVGYCLKALKDFAAARSSYDQALAIREALAAADPKNVRLQEAVAYAHLQIGSVNLEAGTPAAALAEYRKALRIREAVSRVDASNARSRGHVAGAFLRIAEAQVAIASKPELSIGARRGAWREARGAYRRAEETFLVLKRDGKLLGELAGDLEDVAKGIAQCNAELGKRRGNATP